MCVAAAPGSEDRNLWAGGAEETRQWHSQSTSGQYRRWSRSPVFWYMLFVVIVWFSLEVCFIIFSNLTLCVVISCKNCDINNLFLTGQERQESPRQRKFNFCTLEFKCFNILLLNRSVFAVLLSCHWSVVNHNWDQFWVRVVCRSASRVHTGSAEGSRDPQQTESTLPPRDWAGSGTLRTST